MGQKVNPTLIRLGISKPWQSTWFASKKDFAAFISDDAKIRDILSKAWVAAGVSDIHIERPSKSVKVTVFAGRPGVIIGRKGDEVDRMRLRLSKLLSRPVHITIKEIRKPDLNAALVAQNIAQQLERRAMFRRVLKRSVQSAMKLGAEGVKVCLGGRLGGAEIARKEWVREGRVPLHTFRADVDYATAEAHTTYGIIGVKVWIFKSEKTAESKTRVPDRKAED